MSGPEAHPEETSLTTRMRRIRWDALAAIIASLVGLLALLVAGYTAYIQRQQVRAQVWPYVLIGHSDMRGRAGILIFNKGVGPAIIKSVQVLANGKPIQDWDALMPLLGFKATSEVVRNTLYSNVLTPGQRLDWIAFQGPSDIHALLADWKRFHVKVRVCYSSTLGESWLLIYSAGHNHRIEVSSCPKLPDSAQFRG